MKEVQSALSTAAADDSKLVLLSAVGSVFCCGLDFIYFIRRLTDDRKRESTKMAEAIRYADPVFPHGSGRVLPFAYPPPPPQNRLQQARPPLRHTGSKLIKSAVFPVGLAPSAACLEQITHFKAGSSPARAPGTFQRSAWTAAQSQSARCRYRERVLSSALKGALSFP